ncbi:hypothetical protein [Aquibacillus kalidii]|uniref:hypothetical protein n=1 Tax=Aquibacillus kalidii TaxID=2762597 RepID=UPI001645FB07|nr:hypothetical protein [Aquibacillus kalidii]
MNQEIALFEWSQIWEVAGPFIIMGIAALIIGIIFLIIISAMPKGLMKELVRILAILSVIGGSLLALYIASQIWGQK